MDEKYDILPDIQNSLKLWCSQYDFHEPYNQQFHDFLYDTLRRVTDMINSELLDAGLGYLADQFCDSSEFADDSWAIKHGC